MILDAVSPSDRDKAAELLTEQLCRLSSQLSKASIKPLDFNGTLGFIRFVGLSINQMHKGQRYIKGSQENGVSLFSPLSLVAKHLRANPIQMHSGEYTYEVRTAGSEDDFKLKRVKFVYWSLIDRLILHLKNSCDSSAPINGDGDRVRRLGSPLGRRGQVILANIESDHGGGTQSIIVVFNSQFEMSTENRDELGKFDAKESWEICSNTIIRSGRSNLVRIFCPRMHLNWICAQMLCD